MHLYNSDPHSGAGNCTCGREERHRVHFHAFISAYSMPWYCTCGLEEQAFCHVWKGNNETANS